MKLSRTHSRILPAYSAVFFLSIQAYLVLYINSSFLDKYVSEAQIGLLYAIASVVSILFFLNIGSILNKIGNINFTVSSLFLVFFSTLGMVYSTNYFLALLSFVVYQAFITLLFFNLDIFLEFYIKDESTTGRVRSIFLTLSNLALVISPIFTAMVLTNGDYWKVYLLSLVALLPVLLIVKKYFKSFKDSTQKDIKFFATFSRLVAKKDVFRISLSRFILEIFYSLMVVYVPIYLHQHIGLSWTTIGFLFTIMLLPFILFEIPIGRLADKKFGEKEILILGFMIIAVSTVSITFINSTSFIIWAIVLFLTRTGASFVEITTESYFFKHVTSKDAQTIALFRSCRPLSYIVGPVLGGLLLLVIPHKFIYLILGLVVLLGIRFGSLLKDTK